MSRKLVSAYIAVVIILTSLFGNAFALESTPESLTPEDDLQVMAAQTEGTLSNGAVKWEITEQAPNSYLMTFSGTGRIFFLSNPWENNDYRTYITDIVIEEGITYIISKAFKDFNRLESIVIPSTIQTIGTSVFEGCVALKKITINAPQSSVTLNGDLPDGVEVIWAEEPAEIPTPTPTVSPTPSPTAPPTDKPTEPPTAPPTDEPTTAPEDPPTSSPYIPVETIDPESRPSSGSKDSILWHYSDGVLTILGIYRDSLSYSDSSEIEWNQYGYSGEITSVVFAPDSNVSFIPKYLFSDLINLKTVSIPESVKNIEEKAFYNCASLESITFPADLRAIGASAFEGCKSLQEINIPETCAIIGADAFKKCDKVKNVRLPKIYAPNGKLSYYFGGDELNVSMVPNSIRSVEIYAATEIADYAFENCKFIESIVLNDEVSSIGNYAFLGCKSLKRFDIPSNVTSISEGTFKDCWSITVISVPDSVQSIGKEAFMNCELLSSVYIPYGVKTVQDSTFSGCKSISTIEIPDSVKYIGENVLNGCTSLYSVKIPFIGASSEISNVNEKKYEQVFGYLFGKEMEVPPSVTKVEVTNTVVSGEVDSRYMGVPPYAFQNCSCINDIIIDGGRTVYKNAFEGCAELKNLFLPKTIESINEDILVNARTLETLTVPFVGKNRGDGYAEGTASSVLGYFFGSGSSVMENGDVEQMYAPGKSLYYHIPKTLKNVVVLAQTVIPYGAFSNCTSLERVSVISAASMKDMAFYDCNYLELTRLPNDMTAIGESAFAECDSLNTINIPAKVKSIGSSAFYNSRNLRNIVIPDSVDNIEKDVFKSDVFNGTSPIETMANELGIMSDQLNIIGTENNEYLKNYAQSNGFNYTAAPKSFVESTSTFTIVSRLSDNSVLFNITGNEGGVVYIALYDDNDLLINVVTAEKEIDNGVIYTFTESEFEGVKKAKIFLWDGVKPLTKAEVHEDVQSELNKI